MFKKPISLLIAGIFFISCRENNIKKNTEAISTDHAISAAEPKGKFKDVAFASKKDLICGMPVSAGVADTAHYKGKVYGFCAKECKAEFLKNPKQYLNPKN